MNVLGGSIFFEKMVMVAAVKKYLAFSQGVPSGMYSNSMFDAF